MQNITIKLSPSRPLVWLYLSFAFLALVSVSIIPTSVWLRLTFIALILTFLGYDALKKVLLLHPHSVTSMHYFEDGHCHLQFQASETMTMRLRHDSFIAPFFMCLRFQSETSRHKATVLLCPSRDNQQQLRRLSYLIHISQSAKQKSVMLR